MEVVRPNDKFNVKLASYLTDFDRKIISELYQPIIGFGALSLFFTLWSKYERKQDNEYALHSMIFDTMQINQKDFGQAKRKLEAVGLLRTFEKTEGDNKIYLYILYGPKSPREFFDDVLFSGLLTKTIGQEQAHLIAKSFECRSKKDQTDLKEVTASFVDEFKPDFDDECFENTLNEVKTYGRKVRNINTEFDFDSFFEQLEKDYSISKTIFSKVELNEIERLSVLYGIDELAMSEFVNDSLDITLTKGKRLLKATLEDLCKKEQNFVQADNKPKHQKVDVDGFNDEIKLMETLSCKDYIVYLQKGAKASNADLGIVSTLATDYKLNTNAINAILYYTLEKCNNKLPRLYIEKVAASVVRESLKTAADVYQYLYGSYNDEDEAKNVKSSKKTSKEISQALIDNSDDEIDENLALELASASWR